MTFALGFLAALAVLSLAFLVRARRWRRLHRAGALGSCSVGAAGRRGPFRGLFSRLDTSPSQEQVLVDEAAALRDELRRLREDWATAREELARLLGEPALDAARIEASLAAHDDRLLAVRHRFAEALARFHGVLDEAQRTALAALVREGRGLAPSHSAHRH